MIIEPNSKIRIIKSPIELDSNNQLTFSTIQAQETYFKSLPYIEIDDSSYQRKDGYLRFPEPFDNAIKYNYCMYQNSSYSNKWFYAFITNVEYLNDEVTAMYLETDVYQTWVFDMMWRESFIEREMLATADDIVGANTQPENLELGDFISCKLQPSFYHNPETCFVVGTTEQITSGYTTFNQILPIGLYYYGLTTLQGIKDLIKILDDRGKGDTVNSVFVTLKSFFYDWTTLTDVDGQISSSIRFDYDSSVTVTKVNYLGNDYIPKNKKLLTYPYSFLQVSNHSGQVINYKWENFNLLSVGETPSTDITFNIKGTITPGGSMKAYPINYNNILNDFDDDIVIGKYPIGAFTNDVYTNWLTQNSLNIPLNIVSGALSTATGFATGNPIGAASGILGIANTLGSVYEHSLIPDSVTGNTNTGDVNFTAGLTNLEFKRMSIKNEYARVIDNFFSMYGYKTNLVKLPNLSNRSKWNYVKTINANILGDIPQKDLQKIKDLFNNGITLWHNPLYFLDYSQTNS